MSTIYDRDLAPNGANHAPLTPLNFLRRAALVHPGRPAVIEGGRSWTWGEFDLRCRRLAAALAGRGIGPGDTVAVLAPNVPAVLEAHFGVLLCGGVLNAINTRLDARAIAFILDHGESRVLIYDRELAPVVRACLELTTRRPLLVEVPVEGLSGDAQGPAGALDYEALLAEGDPETVFDQPRDEWQACSLNYTSGTTGNPKGVVYHHRGAYLNAVSNALVWALPPQPVYLWTLPMFHCNGWCFPWTLAAMAGTSVCLRQVRAEAIFDAIDRHDVTHLCGAPVVVATLANAPQAAARDPSRRVQVMTAGAAPPAAVIEKAERAGFQLMHAYGLTETYGPAVVCEPQSHWATLPPEQRSAAKARQGVRYPMLEDLMVAHPETLEPVPRDGQTLGEVFFRGNVVMKGYLKNPEASERAFAGGWFHSGDLAVWHADGYIQIKDRSKDIIISGGENISSIEIEDVLFRHPGILDAAVVAGPHQSWGETPVAFVNPREGVELDEAAVIAYCREHLAHFKCPTRVLFGPIAKTATGKVQKYRLRAAAREAAP